MATSLSGVIQRPLVQGGTLGNGHLATWGAARKNAVFEHIIAPDEVIMSGASELARQTVNEIQRGYVKGELRSNSLDDWNRSITHGQDDAIQASVGRITQLQTAWVLTLAGFLGQLLPEMPIQVVRTLVFQLVFRNASPGVVLNQMPGIPAKFSTTQEITKTVRLMRLQVGNGAYADAIAMQDGRDRYVQQLKQMFEAPKIEIAQMILRTFASGQGFAAAITRCINEKAVDVNVYLRRSADFYNFAVKCQENPTLSIMSHLQQIVFENGTVMPTTMILSNSFMQTVGRYPEFQDAARRYNKGDSPADGTPKSAFYEMTLRTEMGNMKVIIPQRPYQITRAPNPLETRSSMQMVYPNPAIPGDRRIQITDYHRCQWVVLSIEDQIKQCKLFDGNKLTGAGKVAFNSENDDSIVNGDFLDTNFKTLKRLHPEHEGVIGESNKQAKGLWNAAITANKTPNEALASLAVNGSILPIDIFVVNRGLTTLHEMAIFAATGSNNCKFFTALPFYGKAQDPILQKEVHGASFYCTPFYPFPENNIVLRTAFPAGVVKGTGEAKLSDSKLLAVATPPGEVDFRADRYIANKSFEESINGKNGRWTNQAITRALIEIARIMEPDKSNEFAKAADLKLTGRMLQVGTVRTYGPKNSWVYLTTNQTHLQQLDHPSNAGLLYGPGTQVRAKDPNWEEIDEGTLWSVRVEQFP